MHAKLLSISGHKFVVIDSTYDMLIFLGNSKVAEPLVKAMVSRLDRFCRETNSTILCLWHPSRAGSERGDASGWSVAWDNAPRVRLSITADKQCKDAFVLKVEKRNNMAMMLPITLHWADGALLPQEALAGADRQTVFEIACINLAIDSAAEGQPLKAQNNLSDWQLGRLETYAGFRPIQKQVKEALAKAVHEQKLRYVRGTNKSQAGYFAFDDPLADPMVTHGSTEKPFAERPRADWSSITPKVAPSPEPVTDYTPLNDHTEEPPL